MKPAIVIGLALLIICIAILIGVAVKKKKEGYKIVRGTDTCPTVDMSGCLASYAADCSNNTDGCLELAGQCQDGTGATRYICQHPQDLTCATPVQGSKCTEISTSPCSNNSKGTCTVDLGTCISDDGSTAYYCDQDVEEDNVDPAAISVLDNADKLGTDAGFLGMVTMAGKQGVEIIKMILTMIPDIKAAWATAKQSYLEAREAIKALQAGESIEKVVARLGSSVNELGTAFAKVGGGIKGVVTYAQKVIPGMEETAVKAFARLQTISETVTLDPAKFVDALKVAKGDVEAAVKAFLAGVEGAEAEATATIAKEVAESVKAYLFSHDKRKIKRLGVVNASNYNYTLGLYLDNTKQKFTPPLIPMTFYSNSETGNANNKLLETKAAIIDLQNQYYTNVSAIEENALADPYSGESILLTAKKHLTAMMNKYNYCFEAMIFPASQITAALNQNYNKLFGFNYGMSFYGIDKNETVIQITPSTDLTTLIIPAAFPTYVDTTYRWFYDDMVIDMVADIASSIKFGNNAVVKHIYNNSIGNNNTPLYYMSRVGGSKTILNVDPNTKQSILFGAGPIDLTHPSLANFNYGEFQIGVTDTNLATMLYFQNVMSTIPPKPLFSLGPGSAYANINRNAYVVYWNSTMTSTSLVNIDSTSPFNDINDINDNSGCYVPAGFPTDANGSFKLYMGSGNNTIHLFNYTAGVNLDISYNIVSPSNYKTAMICQLLAYPSNNNFGATLLGIIFDLNACSVGLYDMLNNTGEYSLIKADAGYVKNSGTNIYYRDVHDGCIYLLGSYSYSPTPTYTPTMLSNYRANDFDVVSYNKSDMLYICGNDIYYMSVPNGQTYPTNFVNTNAAQNNIPVFFRLINTSSTNNAHIVLVVDSSSNLWYFGPQTKVWTAVKNPNTGNQIQTTDTFNYIFDNKSSKWYLWYQQVTINTDGSSSQSQSLTMIQITLNP